MTEGELNAFEARLGVILTRSEIDYDLEQLLTDTPALISALREAWRERDEVRCRVEFMVAREDHFADALRVADGGVYRSDWDAAISRVVSERDRYKAALEKIDEPHDEMGYAYDSADCRRIAKKALEAEK